MIFYVASLIVLAVLLAWLNARLKRCEKRLFYLVSEQEVFLSRMELDEMTRPNRLAFERSVLVDSTLLMTSGDLEGASKKLALAWFDDFSVITHTVLSSGGPFDGWEGRYCFFPLKSNRILVMSPRQGEFSDDPYVKVVFLDSNAASYIGTFFDKGRVAKANGFESWLKVASLYGYLINTELYEAECLSTGADLQDVEATLSFVRQFHGRLFCGTERRSVAGQIKSRAPSSLGFFEQDELLNLFNRAYACLLKVSLLKISRKIQGNKRKIEEYGRWMHECLGVWMQMDFELGICFLNENKNKAVKRFFCDVSFSKDKSVRDLIGTLRNMAWDLTHLRAVQRTFGKRIHDKCVVSCLLSFDEKLMGISNHFKVDSVWNFESSKNPVVIRLGHLLTEEEVACVHSFAERFSERYEHLDLNAGVLSQVEMLESELAVCYEARRLA